MNFDNLLSRADDLTLQSLLGKPSLKLINLLDSKLSSPKYLREVIVQLKTRAGLLRDRASRSLLIDLMKFPEAVMLSKFLGVSPEGDIYEFLKALRIPKGSDREQRLFDFFELGTPFEEECNEAPLEQPIQPNYQLFEHQRRAVREIKTHLYQEPRRVLLHMPTGSGKTRTAVNIIADHFRSCEPTTVIWLAHSEELCEQAISEFLKAWQFLGDRKISVYRFWGNYEIDASELKDGLFVAGLSKLYNRLRKDTEFIGKIGNKSSLVIIDEAHQAVAKTYKLILDNLVVPHPQTSLLGLTATPGRTWSDVESDEELSEFFARRKVMLQITGYVNPVDHLVEEQYLAKTTFRSLLHESSIKVSSADLKAIEEELEIPYKILEQLANDEQRNLKIILEIEKLANTHCRIIVFSNSVNHSNLLASVLRIRGSNADSITKDTSSYDRERIIANFRNDDSEAKILCNFGVLTTGFDAPRTSAAVIARPTKSLVLYSQMVGRAIRGLKAGGNATAEVVTLVDTNLPGFRSIADSFTNWEDVWR